MATKAKPESAPLWTAEEVAGLLRCEPRTVRRKTKTEGLPFVRVASNRMLFDPAKVREWIERRATVLAREAPAAKGDAPGATRAEPLKLPGWDGVRRAGRRRPGA